MSNFDIGGGLHSLSAFVVYASFILVFIGTAFIAVTAQGGI